ncbi:MAG TPA: hypothetical protein H9875_07370 [Candidatus Levilactobacillus faecigallinarum]|uniref:Uncharacterized protein n=1 Tax=Candidatus Levilactobacillus faecigallinarum TaxID=2838638 RepID=A0A9D1QTB0_9LACO|nr:hypothetical protein [Candidatus Levilactobacillus faecigallinarum]
MKVVATLLFILIPGGVTLGTVWFVLAWQLTGWVLWLTAFGGLLLGTLLSLALYWFVWPRRRWEDEPDDSEQ